ncbi:ATP-binding protein [Flammeovirgaceae bacterium SG7u.111]|nr:ATP-binding protein [Flammeovirgaceae bacterium SG7u.132]WPO36652.1 ATP-binding protein [Flammeovirgaceae bacterium SG7u.111]
MSKVYNYKITTLIAYVFLLTGITSAALCKIPPSPEGLSLHKPSFWIEGDSVKAAYFNKVAAFYLQNKQADSAIYFSQKALEEYESTFPTCVTVKSYLTAARGHIEVKELGSALRFYMKSVKMLENMDESNPKRIPYLRSVYAEMGDLYKSWGLPKSALDYYLKVKSFMANDTAYESHIGNLQLITGVYLDMELYEKAVLIDQELLGLYYELDRREDVAVTLKKISDNFVKLEEHEAALEYSFKYLAINRELGNKVGVANALNDIGFIYKDLEDCHKSLSYFLQYLIQMQPLEKKGKTLSQYKETLLTIGLIYNYLGDLGVATSYTHALNYYDKKLKIDIAQSDKKEMARTCNLIADTYLKLKDEDKAEEFSLLGLGYGKMVNSMEVMSESYLNLYESYSKKKKMKKALTYFKLHDALEDSLHEQDIERRRDLMRKEMAENRMQYITNKREQMIIDEELSRLTIGQLELESERQRQELQLLTIDNELRETALKNEQLEKAQALQELRLIQQQIETERQERIIALLEKNKQIQELMIKKQELEKEEKQKEVKLLEKEKKYQELQLSKQETLTKYSVGIVILVSIILVLILYNYLHARRANKKLGIQKEQILTQAIKLEQSYKNLELLSHIGQDITSSLSVEKVAKAIYKNINNLMDATVFGVGIYNAQQETLNFTVLHNDEELSPSFFVPVKAKNQLAAYCYSHKKEIFIQDFENECAAYSLEKACEGLVSKEGKTPASLIMIPLLVQDKVIGVLTVQSYEKDAYTDYHLNLMRNIAIYAKIALENAAAYMQLAIKSENLKSANENIIAQKKTIELKNEELLELNEEKNHLIGVVAHDLRNPLAIAISLTNFVLSQTEGLGKTQTDGLNVTQRSLLRMDGMIKKILDVEAIDSNRINIQLEEVEMDKLLFSVGESLAEQAKKKKIQFVYQIETEQIQVNADRNYLTQVMENLMSNALKFSEPGEEVLVRVFDADDSVRLSVIDQGPGVSKKDRRKLFKKFQKLSAKPTGGEQSIGLGLSIVKKYMEAMGGKVWCDSNLGEGACFSIELAKASAISLIDDKNDEISVQG